MLRTFIGNSMELCCLGRDLEVAWSNDDLSVLYVGVGIAKVLDKPTYLNNALFEHLGARQGKESKVSPLQTMFLGCPISRLDVNANNQALRAEFRGSLPSSFVFATKDRLNFDCMMHLHRESRPTALREPKQLL